MMTGENII